jgi:tetratricopeptide (TPR) repeat protein
LARSQFPEAIAEFEAERTLNPLLGEVYDRLGDAYIHVGDYAKAQDALDQAVLLEPTSAVPFILLGKVLLKQKVLVMAEQYLQKALAIDPRSYIAHALLGETYRSLGRTEQASHEFQLVERIQAAVTGDLTLQGTTKPVTFAVEGPSAPGKDPWGNTRIGLSATTKINRKDFGLTWNAALESGGILVGEDVQIVLDVQFIQS